MSLDIQVDTRVQRARRRSRPTGAVIIPYKVYNEILNPNIEIRALNFKRMAGNR